MYTRVEGAGGLQVLEGEAGLGEEGAGAESN